LNCSIQNGLHDTTDNYGTRVSQMQWDSVKAHYAALST
jgi:hypothetical protein